jgi:sulfur carrier protein ThiS
MVFAGQVRMKLFLGGYLDFYNPQPGSPLIIELDQPVVLTTILTDLGIPLEEVQLVVVNGELVELEKAVVTAQDEVKIFSAVGGG